MITSVELLIPSCNNNIIQYIIPKFFFNRPMGYFSCSCLLVIGSICLVGYIRVSIRSHSGRWIASIHCSMDLLVYIMPCVFYFLLFSTYQLMAEEKGLVVDFKGFDSAMEAARERSRSAQTKVSYLLECLFSVPKFLIIFKTSFLFLCFFLNFLLLLSASWWCHCHGGWCYLSIAQKGHCPNRW